MITPLIALFMIQVVPNATIMRPVPVQPSVTPVQPQVQAVAPHGRKQRMISDARALIERAERVNAAYQPAPEGPTKAELEASIGDMKSDLDSMSEMGEME